MNLGPVSVSTATETAALAKAAEALEPVASDPAAIRRILDYLNARYGDHRFPGAGTVTLQSRERA